MWHNLLCFIIFPLKGHVQLFLCLPVIFQGILLIVLHLHNNFQKQMLFFNSPFWQWGLSIVQCVQVLMTVSVCLFNHSYNKKGKSKMMLIEVIFSNVRFLYIVTHGGPLPKKCGLQAAG
jgi:hypothetical protein